MNLSFEYVAELALAISIAFAVWVLAMGVMKLVALAA
jgi:hypothetical protein